MPAAVDIAESQRLAEDHARDRNWKRWGPYLSERQWGTVREDYSADGDCWNYFPHDHARSRAYRWGEDGLLGICDRECRLCFALALWNGRDPILKERLFGLTGPRGQPRRGRQGVLLLPRLHADALLHEGALQVPAGRVSLRAAGRGEPPPRQARAGVRAGRHRRVRRRAATSTCSPSTPRPRPNDILIRITVANRGPDAATLHLLPTLWFRNTWSWGCTDEGYWAQAAHRGGRRRERRWREHATLGEFRLDVERRPAGRAGAGCSPRTRPTPSGSSASPNATPYVKDAFHDYVDRTAARDAVNPSGVGTKAAAHYRAGRARRRRVTRARCACSRRRGGRRHRSARSSTTVFAARGARGRRVLRAAHAGGARRRTSGASLRQAYAGLLWTQAVLPLRRAATGSTAIRRSRRRPPARQRAATPTGRTSTTATSSRCPTSGSTRGTPPGTWRST